MARRNINYTLREILIVIIGITIAFSMNKCAENIKEKKLRTEYLTNLKSDIKSDRIALEKNVAAITEKIDICASLIPILNVGKKQDMQLMNQIFTIVNYETFNPKNITYKTLINSGDLKLINNFKLKAEIQGHYSNYDDMQDVYARHTSLIQDYLGNYLVNNADYDQISLGQSPFLDEIKLKNIVRALTTTFVEKKKATLAAIESCDTILTELE